MSILKIYRGAALQAVLAEIIAPVRVTYTAVDQPDAGTWAALQDLAALTPHLALEVGQAPGAEADRVSVQGSHGRPLVFVGPPLGLELAALVSAIVVAGRGRAGLLPATQAALARLARPVHLAVFTTPT